jgi:uncharacterized protein YkwD
MKRPFFRRTPILEQLEKREVLSAGGPSAEAQYMLELINQARTNPAAAADRFTSNLDSETIETLSFFNTDLNQAKHQIVSAPAKPPLAWDDALAASAQKQSEDEATLGQQTHLSADGADLGTRLDRAGFHNRASAAENTFAYARSVDQAMQAFLIDWGVPDKGHLRNLLQPDSSADDSFQSVGIGIVNTNKPGIGPKVITQDFGRQNGDKADLLGVVFNDLNGDHFYQPGEGSGDVTVEAHNLQTNQSSSVQTWDAGGYQIPLDPGQYRVTAKVGNRVVGSQQVSVGTRNVKVNFDLSQPFIQPQVMTPAPVVTPPPPAVTPPPPPPPVDRTPTPPVINFSAPVIAPVASAPKTSTPSFHISWITNWTSWNASTGQLAS